MLKSTTDVEGEYVWPPTRRLEEVAREIAAEWGLPLGERFPMSRFAFAAPLGEFVLKITPPEDDQADQEPDALKAWAGNGAVRVLRHDPRRRAMLLERIWPGNDASTVSEAEAIAALLDVGPRLWRTVAAGAFPSAREFIAEELDRRKGVHPLVDTARDQYERIESPGPVLLHGDLHHHNLLRSVDGWAAVDPKPLLGDPEFDVTAFLWNPVDETPTPERTERAIEAFAGAGLDEARIRAWAIVRGTLWDLPLDPGQEEGSRPLAVVRDLLARP